ncbi:MAG TPA: class I SAM-dependent methyltransferase [Gemmatimonadales bacterium]|nr:class I SAM-dependent methyltransferase [Gemmatimonadales bacterium]
MAFKDHFSRDSKEYAEYRPSYPEELFAWLASVGPGREMAWDAGTGNGQAAVALAAHYEHVIASDPSDKQIDAASRHPRIEYRVAAEIAGLVERSADLVTVAQALHWFDRPTFWNEVRRVLRPGGVIAVWCYELQQVSPEVDAVINRFYRDTVGPYWTPDRKLVEEGYRTIEFPFEEFAPPLFSMATEWTLEHQVGYLGTWSAVGKYRKEKGSDPVELVLPELERVWGKRTRRVEWPLSVRAGRV